MDVEIKTANETLGLELDDARVSGFDDLVPWFAVDYKISELITEFWGISAKARLIAVTRNINDKAWKGLVSEWDTNTNVAGQFRINRFLIEELLRNSLGDNLKPFKLKNITDLELSIFENFFVEMENFWQDYWKVSLPKSNGIFIYLIWVIEIKGSEIGAIAIGVPPGIVPKNFQEKVHYDIRQIAAGLDITVPIDLTAGKTTIKISDVKFLEEGDLIVFEKSSADYLAWGKSELEQMKINIEIPAKDNSRFADLYYDELEIADIAEIAEENMNSDDLLTDLPVELTAQFKSVHMPLQKIIELESGGILPLGLLMDSKLTLVAPGDKPIASGNLVIVGNQFGIKIDKTNIKKPVEARLNYSALEASQEQSRQAPVHRQEPSPRPAPMPQQDLYRDNLDSVSNYSDEDLEQELEDIGIDPKELDELEDLY
jgi:flagellar motor switch/type III secretory pathway protein FliN